MTRVYMDQRKAINKACEKYMRTIFNWDEWTKMVHLYFDVARALNEGAMDIWKSKTKEIQELHEEYRAKYFRHMVSVYDSQCCHTDEEVIRLAEEEVKAWELT